MKRALVTGVTGQDGLYLCELLLSKGYEVYGLMRGQNNPKRHILEAIVPEVKILTGDLTDLSSLMRALDVAQPDEFYNLGAISFVAYSWENAHLTSEVTGIGVLNALESVRLYQPRMPAGRCVSTRPPARRCSGRRNPCRRTSGPCSGRAHRMGLPRSLAIT